MTRFFVEPDKIQNDTIYLSRDDMAHIRSLRLKPTETFTVCDSSGMDYICNLGDKSDGSTAKIVDKYPSKGEPNVDCTVYIAYSKGDRLDYSVQKSVELGANKIVLFPSARCISVPSNVQKKIDRLQRIAYETAKLCFRGYIPQVSAAESFESVINQAVDADLPLYFYELEEELSLKKALENTTKCLSVSPASSTSPALSTPAIIKTITIVTGPEGGFEASEAQYARNKGMTTVSLGSRILRCETAPIAALAIIMFYFGELQESP